MIFSLDKFLNDSTGRILLSIIWGLGLATLFKKVCTGRNCQVIQYEGPSPKEVDKKIYQDTDDKCYKFHPYQTKCDTIVN